MKTDKKIEKIIDKKFETCWVDKRSAIAHVHKDRIEELKSELNTELQKAVEEAVEGFSRWQCADDDNSDEYYDLYGKQDVEEYLESEGK